MRRWLKKDTDLWLLAVAATLAAALLGAITLKEVDTRDTARADCLASLKEVQDADIRLFMRTLCEIRIPDFDKEDDNVDSNLDTPTAPGGSVDHLLDGGGGS